jgi:hypothetical protein
MRPKFWLLIGMGVLGVIALWWLAVVPSSDVTDAALGAVEPQSAAAPPSQSGAPQLAAAPEAPVPAPNALPPPAATAEPPRDPLRSLPAQGPVAELQRSFDAEARPSAASELEGRIEKAFRNPKLDPRLFKSAICHQTVCKVEVRWSQPRMEDYMIAITELLPNFAADVGVSPAAEHDAQGVFEVSVYLKRKP